MSKLTSQTPFIMFNGEEYPESSAIISFLSKYFKIDEMEGLSPDQWAISRAISKMVEEDLLWYDLSCHKWILNGKLFCHVKNKYRIKYLSQ